MSIFFLALTFYFAAVLGVSGLGKLEQPKEFGFVLRQYRLFPSWSIGGVSHLFPWAEMMIAAALITGIARMLVAFVVLALFVSFFIMRALLMKRAGSECGCYGAAYKEQIDGASLSTATLFVGLAIVYTLLGSRYYRNGKPVGVSTATCVQGALRSPEPARNRSGHHCGGRRLRQQTARASPDHSRFLPIAPAL